MEKKYYIIIIAVLVLLNIFSWRIWWEGPKHKKSVTHQEVDKGKGQRGGGGIGYFTKSLNLKEDQEKELEELRKSYFKSIEVVKDSMSTARMDMISSLKEEMDFSVQDEVMTKMAGYKLRIEKLTVQHFNDIRKICNDEQRAVYDTLIIRMIERNSMFKKDGRTQGKHRRGMGSKEHRE